MQSKILNNLSGLIHGFSTRDLGDMRQEKNRNVLVRNLVLPEQVHGNIVHLYSDKTTGADGVVANQKGVFVGVLVADCVPILMVDPKRRIVAAVHAGWQGTLGNIIINAVNIIGKDILVWIGPHIGPCCYTVPKERAQLFGSNRQFIDIGLINKKQLLESGIREDHIELSHVCTSCRSDIFYSYRKDSKESFGEMLAYIGFT